MDNLKYLFVILDNDVPSFCFYSKRMTRVNTRMNLKMLKDIVLFAIKENLIVNFLVGSMPLSRDYKIEINKVQHIMISNTISQLDNDDDILLIDSSSNIAHNRITIHCNAIMKIERTDLPNLASIYENIEYNTRLNINLGGINKFDESDFNIYKQQLRMVCDIYVDNVKKSNLKEVNIISDRLMLNRMNNCGAGDIHLSFAPNGKFYICPGFYFDKNSSVGDLDDGINIKNKQLYRLDHSPICVKCDAFQCRRCVYLNKLMTCEVNVPSHEQCVLAHIEREASIYLFNALKEHQIPRFYSEIIPIDYLDPFEKFFKEK